MLDLDENIRVTAEVVELAHKAGVPCEAEVGAVMRDEQNPVAYEELYDSGLGFTDPEEARRFVRETGCDWLSVAIGNIHGAVSDALRHKKKIEAKLNLDRLKLLAEVTEIPLVLHGGSGVRKEYLQSAIKLGIAKVNVGAENRRAYEAALGETGSVPAAQEAVYKRTSTLIHDYFELTGSRSLVMDG
jgi:fructose/tagatose bisphosphate aldolase